MNRKHIAITLLLGGIASFAVIEYAAWHGAPLPILPLYVAVACWCAGVVVLQYSKE